MDLARVTAPNAEPLTPSSLQQVKIALDAVHAVLDAVSGQLLNENIMNDVPIQPRASAFLCYARQLVEAVQHIDSLIDPSGNASIVDFSVAKAFLLKLGCEPTTERIMQIIELREAAYRFK